MFYMFYSFLTCAVISFEGGVKRYNFLFKEYITRLDQAGSRSLGFSKPGSHAAKPWDFFSRPFDSHECDMSGGKNQPVCGPCVWHGPMFGISIELPSPVSMELPSPERIPSFSTIPLAELPFFCPTHPNASWQDAIWTPKTYLKHQTSAAIWIFGCLGLESRCTFEQIDPHHVCNISELWACLEWLSHVALQRLSEILPLKKGSKSGQLLQSGSL